MISTSPKFQCLLRGIQGSEGPLTTPDGIIYLVSPKGGEILRVDRGGTVAVFANTGGKPAGLQLHADGSIWAADMILGIVRVSSSGKVERIVDQFDGKPIRGCNDLSFDSRGNLYFTAPAGSSGKPGGAVGELFCRSAAGGVVRIGNGFAFPNGIAVAPEDQMVIFAETFSHKLWAAEVHEPGRVSEWKVWATLPKSDGEVAGGDGMDFDADGNLVVTNYSRGALEIFTPLGQHKCSLLLPFKKCSNVHFFPGSDTRLLITEHHTMGLWVFDYGLPGHQQFGWSKL